MLRIETDGLTDLPASRDEKFEILPYGDFEVTELSNSLVAHTSNRMVGNVSYSILEGGTE